MTIMATITTVIIKWYYSKSGFHSLEAALCVPEKNISSIKGKQADDLVMFFQ